MNLVRGIDNDLGDLIFIDDDGDPILEITYSKGRSLRHESPEERVRADFQFQKSARVLLAVLAALRDNPLLVFLAVAVQTRQKIRNPKEGEEKRRESQKVQGCPSPDPNDARGPGM